MTAERILALPTKNSHFSLRCLYPSRSLSIEKQHQPHEKFENSDYLDFIEYPLPRGTHSQWGGITYMGSVMAGHWKGWPMKWAALVRAHRDVGLSTGWKFGGTVAHCNPASVNCSCSPDPAHDPEFRKEFSPGNGGGTVRRQFCWCQLGLGNRSLPFTELDRNQVPLWRESYLVPELYIQGHKIKDEAEVNCPGPVVCSPVTPSLLTLQLPLFRSSIWTTHTGKPRAACGSCLWRQTPKPNCPLLKHMQTRTQI